jgi:phospholipid/cholesterol/gamma-HCH transport system substrate-binding protein
VAPGQFLRTSVGTPAESAVLRSVLGPALGVSPGRVPDLGLLLVGPMARGAEVSLR